MRKGLGCPLEESSIITFITLIIFDTYYRMYGFEIAPRHRAPLPGVASNGHYSGGNSILRNGANSYRPLPVQNVESQPVPVSKFKPLQRTVEPISVFDKFDQQKTKSNPKLRIVSDHPSMGKNNYDIEYEDKESTIFNKWC